MKRASYKYGVQWIALNDDAGAPDATNPRTVSHYITAKLLADLFGVTEERVGADVVAYRRRISANRPTGLPAR